MLAVRALGSAVLPLYVTLVIPQNRRGPVGSPLAPRRATNSKPPCPAVVETTALATMHAIPAWALIVVALAICTRRCLVSALVLAKLDDPRVPTAGTLPIPTELVEVWPG